MSIALDAMGGDHAPLEIVKGAIEAAPLLREKLLLIGDTAVLTSLLPNPLPKNIELVHASEAVGMEEKPLEAYRKKKDSSMIVGAQLVKDGKAQAFVSAGNTGAASATCHLIWRPVEKVHRPAIASQIPNKHGEFLLLDTGASPDVDPEHFVEFAIMGRAYAEKVMGHPNPGVHLLNIGEEEGKGNAFAKQAYKLLQQHEWFRGNIESKDMFFKPVDVVVCDAFVGNIVLKNCEGVAELIIQLIREQVPTHPILRLAYAPLRKIMAPLRKRMDYAEVGGSSLLGLNGLCTICHGRSNAKAIRNALLMTQRAIENDLVGTIRTSAQGEL
ncbi:MAG TPA: phosphate acyltransferase PlsX [Fimbriimonadaceae bacterium]|nr:phosphate acyltransferase PlsX [Fimbriimonadaceae bacterium]